MDPQWKISSRRLGSLTQGHCGGVCARVEKMVKLGLNTLKLAKNPFLESRLVSKNLTEQGSKFLDT